MILSLNSGTGCIKYGEALGNAHKKPGAGPGYFERELKSMTLLVPHAAPQGTTRRTTNAGTHGGPSAAAQAIADQRATGRAQATANRSLGPAALARTRRTTGRPGHTRTNSRPGAAAELLPDHVAQRTAEPTTNGGSAIASHRTLSQQKSYNQGR